MRYGMEWASLEDFFISSQGIDHDIEFVRGTMMI